MDARRSVGLMVMVKKIPMARQNISNIAAWRYLVCFKLLFTVFRIKLIPVMETSHNTNDYAIGNAAR